MPRILSFALVCVAIALGSAACTMPGLVRAPGDPGWRCPHVVEAARRTGWPDDRLAWVDRIAWRESRCRPDAWSPTRDAGAMQIHHRWIGWGLCTLGIACHVTQLFELDVNLRAAAHIYAVQGPNAWAAN
jgi:hypothetical protein